MSEEELYKLAISDVPKYSLLNEILAIRDKRFPDEETDYTINVYGSISLDVLNKYVELVQENDKLKKELEITTFNFKSLSSACGSLAEFMGLDKDAIIEEMIDKVVKDRKEKDFYKSVLKKIREYIKYNATSNYFDSETNMFRR